MTFALTPVDPDSRRGRPRDERIDRDLADVAVAVLAGLFWIQHKGTDLLGRLFGPVMLVWFATIAVIGLCAWGATTNLGTVFAFADVTMGFLALANLIALILLIKPGLRFMRDFDDQLAAGVKRTVLTSSTVSMTTGKPSGRYGTEAWSDVSADIGAYAKSKTLAERAAWELVAGGAMELVVINPGFILGPPLGAPGDGQSETMVKDLIGGKFPMIPDIANQGDGLRAVDASAGVDFIPQRLAAEAA